MCKVCVMGVVTHISSNFTEYKNTHINDISQILWGKPFNSNFRCFIGGFVATVESTTHSDILGTRYHFKTHKAT